MRLSKRAISAAFTFLSVVTFTSANSMVRVSDARDEIKAAARPGEWAFAKKVATEMKDFMSRMEAED